MCVLCCVFFSSSASARSRCVPVALLRRDLSAAFQLHPDLGACAPRSTLTPWFGAGKRRQARVESTTTPPPTTTWIATCVSARFLRLLKRYDLGGGKAGRPTAERNRNAPTVTLRMSGKPPEPQPERRPRVTLFIRSNSRHRPTGGNGVRVTEPVRLKGEHNKIRPHRVLFS